MKPILRFDELTESDVILYHWIESPESMSDDPVFVRGRRRTMDESITLCNGDVKKYLDCLNQNA